MEITKEYNDICSKHHEVILNKNDFHKFINGLYQAEGTLGAYFINKKSLQLRYSFSIGQNYSIEALNVFLSLQKILNVGRVKLEFNKLGRAHIRYQCTNTKDICNIIIPYFSLLYGQKRKDIFVIKEIYKLDSKGLEYTK